MSLILKKYKCGSTFKASDTVVSHLPFTPSLEQLSSQTLKTCPDISFQNPYNYHFGQLDTVDVSPERVMTQTSFGLIRPRRKSPVNISSLYRIEDNEIKSRDSFPNIPPLRIKKPIPTPLPNKSVCPPQDNNENSTLSSSRIEKLKNSHSSQLLNSKDSKDRKEKQGPNISAYLDYLGQTSDSSCELRLQRKLKATLEARRKREGSENMIPTFTPSLVSNIIKAAVKERTGKTPDTLSLDIKKVVQGTMSTPSAMVSEILSSNMDMNRKSRANITAPIKKPKIRSDTSIRKQSFMGSRSRILNKSILNHEEYHILFKDIAFNLQELYKQSMNEKKCQATIEQLAENKLPVLKVVLSKYHKVHDYDPKKLEQKFISMPVTSDQVLLPIKPSKKKEELTIFDPRLIQDLKEFNQKLEEYNLSKKSEALKLVEYSVEETKHNLEQHQRKRTLGLVKKPRTLKESLYKSSENNSSILLKPIDFEPTEVDPMSAVENYQRNQVDYRYLKSRTLEYSKCVSGVFNEWSRYRRDFEGV